LSAAGLSLIFGVTRIINIAHGSLYMLGPISPTASRPGRRGARILGRSSSAAAIVGLIGGLIEIVLLRRIYRAPELFQLLATFALVLVINDARCGCGGRRICSGRVRRPARAVEILAAACRAMICS
jgi:branched-chain amino acid transport system permease protein